VHFDNDLRTASCDRALYVDTVTLHSEVPINTGTMGSICQPTDGGYGSTVVPAGISTTSLGAAPAYYEVGGPTGQFAGKPTKGVVLVVHGGGWFVVGPGAVAASRSEADAWRARGWSTVNLTYRGCEGSLDDVVWFFDKVASISGGRPICATGQSAGGHLVMMLAVRRPSLACAVAKGAPLDLTTLALQTAFESVSGATQATGPTWTGHVAAAAFGQEALSALSPALQAGQIRARVLVATAAADTLVPGEQATGFATLYNATHPLTPTVPLVLASGSIRWVHGGTTTEALDELSAAEAALAASVTM
jgi:acetyl esterase/lipase